MVIDDDDEYFNLPEYTIVKSARAGPPEGDYPIRSMFFESLEYGKLTIIKFRRGPPFTRILDCVSEQCIANFSTKINY